MLSLRVTLILTIMGRKEIKFRLSDVKTRASPEAYGKVPG